jgi:hypothetical protein
VADGHGSPKSFRSATGARFAVEVSQALAAELLTAPGERLELSWVKDRLEQDAPRRIVRDWRARVKEDLARSPFRDEEFAAVRERDGQKGQEAVVSDPYLAYGSTLVTAVATPTFMAFWQIGDGDVLTVSASGAGRPLAGDDRLIANETTSLCSAEAWRLFRVAVFGTPAPLIMVSTDGFANSFMDDQGFFRFGSDILRMMAAEGVEAVDGRLSGWLDEMTQAGSGDDISLAIACRPSDLPPEQALAEPAQQANPAEPAGPADAAVPGDPAQAGQEHLRADEPVPSRARLDFPDRTVPDL